MKNRWTGLVCLYSLVAALAAWPAAASAAQFTIHVPIELRNIPASAGPLTVEVELFRAVNTPPMFTVVNGYAASRYVIKPPTGVTTYDFVQTITFNLDVVPPTSPNLVGAYRVSIMYNSGSGLMALDAANFVDKTKPFVFSRFEAITRP